ncbi:ATP-binding protein [Actinoplanes sp. NPDC051494]|uniref:PAS domain-containing sensor histidine kinase n=1 Tax=Actinoplanes sp. NPDC051494 TaxID=3363907 RepID=UPI00378E0C7B
MALLLITTLFMALLIRVTRGYLRSRDPLLRDVMWVFASVALVFVQAVTVLLGSALPRVVLGVLTALLLAQPVWTWRLVSRLRQVPAWALWAATAGWLCGAVPVVLMDPFPAWLVAPAITEYVVVEVTAAWLLAREARRRGGAARTRLWCAAVGTALFGIAILLTLGGEPVTALSQGLLVVSAVCYVLAFAPPRRLRLLWSRSAAYTLTRRLLEAPVHEPPQRTWQLYCEGARAVAGADGVTVLLGTPPDGVGTIAAAGITGDGDHLYSDAEMDRLLGPPRTVDLHATPAGAPPVMYGVAAGSGARFVTAAPLAVGGRHGALVLLNRCRTLFADDDIALFLELATLAETMAGRAAVVAERERADAMFRDLLEGAPDAIIGVTADGTITLINAQAEHLFGYPRDELLGRPVDILVPEGIRDAHPRHREHFVARAGTQATESRATRPKGPGATLAGVRKDGSEFPAEISLSALETEQGVIVSAAIRDVSERLAAQAEREHLAAQAERDAEERRMQHTRRLESLGQLAGGVAHDFNNILAVIGSYTELGIETLDAPAPNRDELIGLRADLLQISRATERATRLTRQLLAFGRRTITQVEVLSLNDVIGEVEQLLRRAIGEHITLVTELDPELWRVQADPSQLEQILVNLAVNARDAMPGGGTLSIGTGNTELTGSEAVPAPGRYVEVRVGDSGTGMPPEVVERAFEPFYTTKPQGAGTGLGLATVYGIATGAGGDVRIRSAAGAGTTITILLPATDVTAGAANPGYGGAAAGPSAPARGNETILLVEDEEPLRDVTTRILARAGYQVLAADDGAAAIELAGHHPGPVHLLLTDVIMPRMMGNDVAARVHALRPGVPVLYMSGYAQPVLTEHGTLQAGVSLIEKPFAAAQLLERVDAILHPGAPGRSAPAALPGHAPAADLRDARA